MRVNYQVQSATRFSVLTPNQCEEIYLASLEVLETTGVRIHHPEALALLKAAGCRVSDDTLVKIPSWLVKASIGTAPGKISLSCRDGSRRLALTPNHVYFGAGSDTPFIIDPQTGERRKCTYADVADFARLADALPNMDFHMSLGLVSDCPHDVTYDRYQHMAMVTNTVKPIVATAVDEKGLADIHEMACLIAGGEDKFREAPNFAIYIEPSSPLSHSFNCLAKALYASDHEIPMVYTPCPIAGATAPATMAGILVLAIAENLSALVVTQLRRRGAPIVIGGVVSILDMSQTVYAYGAPELHLASAALTDVVKWLGLPMFSTAGCSDSKALDQQAAIEAALSILTAALSGANLIHDVGFLESAITGSAGMLVLSDEIVGMAKRIARGITVDEEHLAVSVIDQVGPGGHFLGEDHTLKHFKKEFWFPRLMDRRNYEEWSADGSKRLSERVEDRVREILAEHQPSPLPAELVAQLKAICVRADQQVAE